MDFRNLGLKFGFAYSVVIFALLAVTFVAANTAVLGLQPEAYDPFWQPKIVALKAFFANGATVVFVAWVTNATGLILIYAKTKALQHQQITYNAWKYYGTLATILGVGVTAFSTLPAPWNQMALAIAATAKIVETSFTKILPRNPPA